MTDKERILMAIITRIIPGVMYSRGSKQDEYIKLRFLHPEKLQPGDLVYANTFRAMHDFAVGFVQRIDSDHGCVVIREIGSNRLCDYYNEGFTVINKDKLGYQILEGLQYKTYEKVLKAFHKHDHYMTRFKSIEFDGDTCTVQSRQPFEGETKAEFSFEYDSKTTIRSIVKMLKEREV